MEIRHRALAAILVDDPQAKVQAVNLLSQAHASCSIDTMAEIAEPSGVPGRPQRPELVDPRLVPQRGLGTLEGRAGLLHAVAHIEFNAIDLALDACWRFGGLPDAYYTDWLRVASEEAHHFTLVQAHLQSLGWQYGDFDAHGGLWEMAERTRHDVLARMALVPRILEARGLDVTPGLQTRLAQCGDVQAADILGVILRDEVGHVAVGNHWYAWLCAQRGVEPQAEMLRLMQQHCAPPIKPPLNVEARLRAGFTPEELSGLVGSSAHTKPRDSNHPRG